MPSVYNDLQIRQKKPSDKRQVLPVGDGVFVVIEPIKKIKNNFVGKSLIGKCRFPPSRSGKQIDIRLGLYGRGEGYITISQAKEEFIKLKKMSAELGLDPREIQKKEKNKKVLDKNIPTLDKAVEGWMTINKDKWSPTTLIDYRRRVFNQILNPMVGGFDKDTPLNEFSWNRGGRDKILTWFDREQKRADKQSSRNLMVLRQIFEWSIDRGWMNHPNPAMTSKNTKPRTKSGNNPFLDWEELDEFIRAVNLAEEIGVNFLVVQALKMVMLTGLRTGTLVQLEFSEIDEENNMLVIPETKMKRSEIHYVPLTKPMREIIQKLERVNKDFGYMFYSHRGNKQPYMREGTINNFIVRIKNGEYFGRQPAHGFRQFMMTNGIDVLKYDERTIDRHLHHAVGSKVERAYNHAKYFQQRRDFMEDWSNALVKKGF